MASYFEMNPLVEHLEYIGIYKILRSHSNNGNVPYWETKATPLVDTSQTNM